MGTRELTREDFQAPRYEPFTCPDRGEFMMLPYISCGAFGAYLTAKDDLRRAFGELFEHSVIEDGPRIPTRERDHQGRCRPRVLRGSIGREVTALNA